jgi:hypothetical protein
MAWQNPAGWPEKGDPMLKRFRIEVEEATIAETVIALSNYEHALVAAEAQRFSAQWPVEMSTSDAGDTWTEPNTRSHWDMETADREFFIDELGVKITEEVIEYDESLPGYKGRRVVRLERVDMRNPHFVPLVVQRAETIGELRGESYFVGDEPGTGNAGSGGAAIRRIAGDPL